MGDHILADAGVVSSQTGKAANGALTGSHFHTAFGRHRAFAWVFEPETRTFREATFENDAAADTEVAIVYASWRLSAT